MVLAVLCSALAPFADGLGAHTKALGQHAGGLGRAGDFLADSRRGAGLRMKGQHQVLPRCGKERTGRSKRQAYSSIAQRTRSQQRSATKQLGSVAVEQPSSRMSQARRLANNVAPNSR